MTPEQQKMLQEVYTLVYENNKMLKSARRSALVGGVLKVAMYALFIVLPMYLFYTMIVPMLNDTAAKVNSVSEKVHGVQTQAESVGSTLQQYKDLLQGSYMSN